MFRSRFCCCSFYVLTEDSACGPGFRGLGGNWLKNLRVGRREGHRAALVVMCCSAMPRCQMTFAGDKASGVSPTLLPPPPGSAEDR